MLTVITDEDVKQALIDFLNKNGSLPEGFGPNLSIVEINPELPKAFTIKIDGNAVQEVPKPSKGQHADPHGTKFCEL